MTIEEYVARYHALAHAIQTGVAQTIALDVADIEKGKASPTGIGTSTKMLRTGINMALIEVGALTDALISAGVISAELVRERQLMILENEVGKYEAELSARMGYKVTLG